MGPTLSMLTDSGSDTHIVDPAIMPQIYNYLAGIRHFSQPMEITTGGDNKVSAVASGVLRASVTKSDGHQSLVHFIAVLAPGMGAHLFSTPKAAMTGSTSVIRGDTAYIENGGRIVPLRPNASKLRYFLDLQLEPRISEQEAERIRASMPETVPERSAVATVSANLWHQ